MQDRKLKYRSEDLSIKESKTFYKSFIRYGLLTIFGIVFGFLVFYFLLDVVFPQRNQNVNNKLLREQNDQLKVRISAIKEKMHEIINMDSIMNIGVLGQNATREFIQESRTPFQYGSVKQLLDTVEAKLLRTENYLPQQFESLLTMYQDIAKIDLTRVPSTSPIKDYSYLTLSVGVGEKVDPIYNETAKIHTGLDIFCPLGTPIFATGDGVVTHVGTSSKFKHYGIYIIIDHQNELKTVYAHLSKTNVRSGQKIKRNTLIGLSGRTGKTDVTHLHYEILTQDTFRDPLDFMFFEVPPSLIYKWRLYATNNKKSFD